MYDFDSRPAREHTGSWKWDFAPKAVVASGEAPLSVADMELRCPEPVIKAIKEAAERGVFGYTYADDEYFEAMRGFLKRRHGYDVEKDWLINTNGIVSACASAVRAFTNEGDSVLVTPPVYYPFFMSIESQGRKVVNSQLILKDGKYEVNFDEFEKLAKLDSTKLFILSNPHNPVGRVWTKEELTRMATICRDNGVVVVADEIHGELIMKGYKQTSFLQIPEGVDNCIVCTAMSKTFNLAGLSLSNIFVPNKELREKFEEAVDTSHTGGVNYFGRAAAIAAFTECDGWLDELLEYIEGNFDYMYSFIEKRLPEIKMIRTEGTYLAWVDMRALGLTNEQQEKMDVEDAHLALDEGYIFRMGGEGFSRWNLAAPRADIVSALERFAIAIERLRASRSGK